MELGAYFLHKPLVKSIRGEKIKPHLTFFTGSGSVHVFVDGESTTCPDAGIPQNCANEIHQIFYHDPSVQKTNEDVAQAMIDAAKKLPQDVFDRYTVEVKTPKGAIRIYRPV